MAGIGGRPSAYQAEIAEEICGRMAGGETLKDICQDERFPAPSTVRLWAVMDREGFSAPYARAREMQVEHWADEIVDISDDGTNDWIVRQVGEDRVETVPDHEHISRSKLRVDSRKWLAAKLMPRTYGDKQQLEHTGKDGGPIETVLTIEQKQARAAALLGETFTEKP